MKHPTPFTTISLSQMASLSKGAVRQARKNRLSKAAAAKLEPVPYTPTKEALYAEQTIKEYFERMTGK